MDIPTQEEIRKSLIVHVENVHGRGIRALSDTPITRGEVINLLAATDWMLVEMDGQPLSAGILPPTTLVQYGKAAGFSGCNRYTGPIAELAPGKLQLGEPAVTRKACDAAANEIEAAFLDRMRATTSYALQAGRLLLVAPQDGESPRTLLFSR